MAIDWSRLRQIIDSHSRFLITSHVRPDGDAIGSELGMAHILAQLGKEYLIVNSSPLPARYRFLDPFDRVHRLGETVHDAMLARAEAVIIVDTSAWIQLGSMADFVRDCSATKAIIDHHVGEDDMGAELFKDSSAAACGVLVAEAAAQFGCTMTREMAEPLFVAIATDTGWFRFGSTDSRTFRIAASLMEAGISVDKLYRSIFEENSLARLKLIARTLDSTRLINGGRVAYATIRLQDLADTGAVSQDCEDLVNHMLSISGVRVGLLFVEQAPSTVKVSFRSRNGVDCTRIASQFGGGGHRQASGATIRAEMTVTQEQVLTAVEREVEHTIL